MLLWQVKFYSQERRRMILFLVASKIDSETSTSRSHFVYHVANPEVPGIVSTKPHSNGYVEVCFLQPVGFMPDTRKVYYFLYQELVNMYKVKISRETTRLKALQEQFTLLE